MIRMVPFFTYRPPLNIVRRTPARIKASRLSCVKTVRFRLRKRLAAGRLHVPAGRFRISADTRAASRSRRFVKGNASFTFVPTAVDGD